MTERRQFFRAAGFGAIPALAIVLAILLSSGGLLESATLADPFDAQSRALLHGHWDVPADVMKVEGFLIDGKTYMYFGPTPALLRLPIVAVTDRFDGRLTRVMLLLAWAVAMVAATRIHWRIRRWRRGHAPVGRRERWAVAGWTATVGAGSSLAFLASKAIVFHEAAAWGVALALLGIEAALAYAEHPSGRRLAAAGAVAVLAILARGSVGAVPALALGALLARHLWRRARDRPGPSWRSLGALALVAILPAVAYAGVNQAKFGTPVRVPWDRHRISFFDAHRQDVLAANHGNIQGPQFLPTTTLHFLRPDAIGVDGRYPWITFPDPATVIGDTVMDEVDESTSVPNAMPLLTGLAAIGAWTIARDRRLRPVLPVLAASAGCLVVTLSIGFVAQRYTADAVPLLVVASAAGLQGLQGWTRWRRFITGTLASLGVLSVLITVALSVQFQQRYGFLVDPDLRARLTVWQEALPHRGEPSVRRTTSELPPVAADGAYAVVGACDGLYRSDGHTWQPVERTPATGWFPLLIDVPEAVTGRIPLVDGVELERTDAAHVTVHLGDRTSQPVAVDDGRLRIDVLVDRWLGAIGVFQGARTLVDDFHPRGGPDPVVATGTGLTVRVLPTPTPACAAVTR